MNYYKSLTKKLLARVEFDYNDCMCIMVDLQAATRHKGEEWKWYEQVSELEVLSIVDFKKSKSDHSLSSLFTPLAL